MHHSEFQYDGDSLAESFLSNKLEHFYLRHAPSILANPAFLSILTSIDFGSEDQNLQSADQKFHSYVSEAVLIVDEIGLHVDKRQRLLEIGGGIGLVYIWLKSQGYNITSIEPSGSGHHGYYQMGQILMSQLGVDPSGWLALEAAQLPTINRQFDFIFSHNVIEHLKPLAENLDAIESVLCAGGMMLHQFPNYTVPYDPHFGIPLLPGAPERTTYIFPRLKDNPLWQSINFITTIWLQRWCRERAVDFQFKKAHWFSSIERLKTDDEFRTKHAIIYRVFVVLETLGWNALLKAIPDHLTTPVQVIMRKNQASG